MNEFPPSRSSNPIAPPIEELLTTAQAAQRLGRAPKTLRAWRAASRGPAYFDVGGRIAYWTRDLDAWLASRRVKPTRA
jgi:hypothetical protein